MKKSDANSKKGRQPYEKPRLGKFSLAADEVLATGCKTSAPSAAVQGAECNSTNRDQVKS